MAAVFSRPYFSNASLMSGRTRSQGTCPTATSNRGESLTHARTGSEKSCSKRFALPAVMKPSSPLRKRLISECEQAVAPRSFDALPPFARKALAARR